MDLPISDCWAYWLVYLLEINWGKKIVKKILGKQKFTIKEVGL